MKLPYLGIHNPILSHFTGRFASNGHSRQATIHSSPLPVTASRFHFRQTAPQSLRGSQWQLRPLSQANAALTYDAYLAHPISLIQQSRGLHLADSYTWQEHMQQIAAYEQDHRTHKAFSFIVLNKTATKCLGMVQVLPLRPFLYYNNAPAHLLVRAGDNAAMITYWLATCSDGSPFACEFIQALQRWFSREWEFDDYYFRINPSDAHCLSILAESGLATQFSLKVPPYDYAFYGN